MKDILEKYNKPLLKEEDEGLDVAKIENAARSLQGQIAKFIDLAASLKNNDHFKQALSYLKGAYRKLPHYMALEMVGEGIEVNAEDLTKMNNRESDKVSDMAKDMKGDVKVVKESPNKEKRYLAKAQFYVYVTDNEDPAMKAKELLSLIDQNHDGSNPHLLGEVTPAMSNSGYKFENTNMRTLSKKDFLNEMLVKQKGFEYKGTFSKNDFLKKLG